MRDGGRGDDGRIEVRNFGGTRVGRATILVRELASFGEIGIDDRGEFDSAKLAEHARVIAAERTGSDNGCAYASFHHGFDGSETSGGYVENRFAAWIGWGTRSYFFKGE